MHDITSTIAGNNQTDAFLYIRTSVLRHIKSWTVEIRHTNKSMRKYHSIQGRN